VLGEAGFHFVKASSICSRTDFWPVRKYGEVRLDVCAGSQGAYGVQVRTAVVTAIGLVTGRGRCFVAAVAGAAALTARNHQIGCFLAVVAEAAGLS